MVLAGQSSWRGAMCSSCSGDYQNPDATNPEIIEIDVRDSVVDRVNLGWIAFWVGIGGVIWGFVLGWVYPVLHRVLTR